MANASSRPPLLTVGMPVFNGENFIAEALRSILAQSFADFELIICDNASTDRTGEICKAFAQQDPRIRYYRHDSNLGAAVNFNSTFQLSEGEFFKWAAHDDLLEPTYLESCVKALEADPDAVLCHSLVRVIDEQGASLGLYDSALRGAGSPLPSERFRALVLSRHLCTDMFGVMRRDAMAASEKHGAYYGGDRSLLAELALIGRFIQVPEPLFLNREHKHRFVRSVQATEWQAWHDMRQPAKASPPTWRLYADYLRAVRRHLPHGRERLRCYWILSRWWFVDWNLGRLIVDLLGRVNPSVYDFVRHLKLRWYGKLPQARIR